MCLAVPARVTEIEGARAKVDLLGNVREADLALVADVAVGDYVLIHAGFAIQKMSAEDARETFELLREIGECADDAGGN
ncbi:HypC/HybG/HupF family hydrogenase formation chaperone [Candidatus Sumerlaeota bacterium]|nr:HypC/HybG/HupF family hydrogenase formation chaperone [Candidatus Sumerlaeota bacterium]